MTGETTPELCERCELPHGTCHHTAPPLEVGDRIHTGMTIGAWGHARALRPNSRARDAEGGVWVRTRHPRDVLWERVSPGPDAPPGPHGCPLWPLEHIIDERQGYGPLTIEHVAGRRKL